MINLICAMDNNRAIGKDNKLLCHLPSDLKRFKRLTEGSIVIMGRKTHQSLPVNRLPNRINVILTRDQNYKPEGCLVFNSIEHLLSIISIEEDVFVIGGSEIYRQFLPYTDRLYLTIINHSFPESDIFFPPIDDNWKVVSHIENKADDKHKYNYHFIDYIKIN